MPDWQQVATKGYAADNVALNNGAYDLGASKAPRSEESGINEMKSACSNLHLQVGYNESNAFVAQMSEHAPEVSYPDAVKFEGLGRALCQDFENGASVQQQVNVLDSSHVAVDVATGVLAGAVDVYCPAFQADLQAYAASH